MVDRNLSQPTGACLTHIAPEVELLLTLENNVSMGTHFQSSTV